MIKNGLIIALFLICGYLGFKKYGPAISYKVFKRSPDVTQNANYKGTRLHHIQIAQQRATQDNTNRIVIIGDSIIQSWDFNLAGLHTVNFGISNDTTEGVIARLNEDWTKTFPNWYLAIGINDPAYNYKIEDIPQKLEILGQKFRSVKTLYWQHILPSAHPSRTLFHPKYVTEFNRLVTQKCTQMENCVLITAPIGYAENLDRLTYDGIHPNAEGYARINDHINKLTSELH